MDKLDFIIYLNMHYKINVNLLKYFSFLFKSLLA